MSRPLIVSDCDEVLLFMVGPFREWLDETQGVDFTVGSNNFGKAMRWRETGDPVEEKDIWRLLRAFFETEMGRQTPIPGAVEAMATLSDHAEIVILTNLTDRHREMRAEQLAKHGISAKVYTNQGPKGPALAAIVEEHGASEVYFIDDLPQHHQSAREMVPGIVTLHLCGEPELAPHIDCAHRAGHADARLDSWDEALPWLLERIAKEPA